MPLRQSAQPRPHINTGRRRLGRTGLAIFDEQVIQRSGLRIPLIERSTVNPRVRRA